MSSQIRDIRVPISANFVAEMDRSGLTVTEAARALGVSERQITRWRGGQTPRYQFVARMARYFGRPIEWFYIDHSTEAAA